MKPLTLGIHTELTRLTEMAARGPGSKENARYEGICEMIGCPEPHPVKKVIGFTEEMLEAWRAKQKPVPNVSEAIRRLVEIGLKAKPGTRR